MADLPQVTVIQPAGEKKRRRPALACEQCRRRKVRCDRSSPCTTCVRSKNPGCTYAPAPPIAAPSRRRGGSGGVNMVTALGAPGPANAHNVTPTALSSLTSQSGGSAKAGPAAVPVPTYPEPGSARSPRPWKSVPDVGSSSTDSPPSALSTASVQSLIERIKLLEWQVETAQRSSTSPSAARSEAPAPIRGMVDKTRFFGQSHWMNGSRLPQFTYLHGIFQRVLEEKSFHIINTLNECKSLARTIKAHRVPVLSSLELGKQMPPREVADKLLDHYFRTFELIYRIVHIPTFRAEYERYWANPFSASQAFVVQLQLCMAIGAAVADDSFSMRSWAVRWTYEAQLWLILPPEKAKLSIPGIQVMCLLQIARQMAAVAGDLTWTSAGSLLRSAMYVGLHRDPRQLPNMTIFRAELHRRLWATILEILVQSSIDAGGPPLISLDDFDTEPPLNLNDDELTEDAEVAERTSANTNSVTEMSIQLLLLKSFPVRLAIAKFVNEFRSDGSFEETLRLDGELTSTCHGISRQLAHLLNASSSSMPRLVTAFHRRLVELMTYRFIIALHFPILPRAMENPAFYFSRKVTVDISRRLSALRLPASPIAPNEGVLEFLNLTTCAAGGFLTPIILSMMLCGCELLKQQEDERMSFGGALSTPSAEIRDLRAVLEEAAKWTLVRTQAGETNPKGHLFVAAILAQADALQRGLDTEGSEALILERMTESLETSLGTLKGMAEGYGIVHPTAGPSEGGMGVGHLAADIWRVGFDIGDWEWEDMTGFLV